MTTSGCLHPRSAERAVFGRERTWLAEQTPLFTADWTQLVFHHFRVQRSQLQTRVPFELDCFHGQAYVSLVAFCTRRIFVHRLGEWTHWLHRPVTHHSFLNLRTYVKHRGEAGVYFLKVFVNSLPAVPLARLSYGLPYHFCNLQLDHSFDASEVSGSAATQAGNQLAYRAWRAQPESSQRSASGSESEFLTERYSAFTWRGRTPRVFRIQHPPWELTPLRTRWQDTSLLERELPLPSQPRTCGSYWTAGTFNVGISRPQRLR